MKTEDLSTEEKSALILACRWAFQNPEGQTVWKELENKEGAGAAPEKPVVVEPRPRHF